MQVEITGEPSMHQNYQDIVIRKENLEKYGPGGYHLHMVTLKATPILNSDFTQAAESDKDPATGMPIPKLS